MPSEADIALFERFKRDCLEIENNFERLNVYNRYLRKKPNYKTQNMMREFLLGGKK